MASTCHFFNLKVAKCFYLTQHLATYVIRSICVIRAGIEPATYALEVRCSIQLSYRTKGQI